MEAVEVQGLRRAYGGMPGDITAGDVAARREFWATMRVEGSRIHLTCVDSDLAVRALLAARPDAADLEIAHGLEDAFVRITRS